MSLEHRARLAIQAVRHPHKAADVIYSLATHKPLLKNLNIPTMPRMTVVLPDYSSVDEYMGLVYEPDVITFMQSTLRLGDRMYDIGAHFGYHTLTAVQLVGEAGEVVSFEPTPSTLQILKQNTGQYPNIRLEQYAVGDGTTSTLELLDFGPRYAGHNTTSVPRFRKDINKRIKQAHRITADAISIDEYFSNHPNRRLNLCKIDVENGEAAVLRGMQHTLHYIRPVIIMEVGDFGRTDENTTSTCLDLLSGKNYFFFEFDKRRKRIVPHQKSIYYKKQENLLCVPAENAEKLGVHYV